MTVCLDRDLPITIRSQHRGADRLEALQHVRRRMTEAIAAATADDAQAVAASLQGAPKTWTCRCRDAPL
jgi:hypothetical protein